jgi:hypothetical protein
VIVFVARAITHNKTHVTIKSIDDPFNKMKGCESFAQTPTWTSLDEVLIRVSGYGYFNMCGDYTHNADNK